MKRVGRWALNILAGLSLLLCVATAALWVRSRHVTDRVQVVSFRGTGYVADRAGSRCGELYFEQTGVSVEGDDAQLAWELLRDIDVNARREGFSRYTERSPGTGMPAGTFLHRLGFGLYARSHRDTWQGYSLTWTGRTYWAPHWFVALLGAALPAIWTAKVFRRQRRRTKGLCAQCGYDLRATPGRCPECGTTASRLPAGENEHQERDRKGGGTSE